jgi:hypothetical protein
MEMQFDLRGCALPSPYSVFWWSVTLLTENVMLSLFPAKAGVYRLRHYPPPPPPRSGKPGDLIKSCPCAAVLLGRLPSDETHGVSSLGCALVAVRACLWVLLYCVHPITFLTSYLSYPTVIPSVRYTKSTLSCL